MHADHDIPFHVMLWLLMKRKEQLPSEQLNSPRVFVQMCLTRSLRHDEVSVKTDQSPVTVADYIKMHHKPSYHN
jgi:hypothetical protein